MGQITQFDKHVQKAWHQYLSQTSLMTIPRYFLGKVLEEEAFYHHCLKEDLKNLLGVQLSKSEKTYWHSSLNPNCHIYTS